MAKGCERDLNHNTKRRRNYVSKVCHCLANGFQIKTHTNVLCKIAQP